MTMTLFTVRADYMRMEYGSLFTVAATEASEAEDLVRAKIQYYWDLEVTIKKCDPIGTADNRFDEPQIVEYFMA